MSRWLEPSLAAVERSLAEGARRHAGSELVVGLEEAARESIMRHVQWTTTQDGLETAGLLYSRVAKGGRVVVTDAFPAALERSRHGTVLDYEAAGAQLASRRVGCFHTHPVGGGKPSSTDLSVWRRRACRERA